MKWQPIETAPQGQLVLLGFFYEPSEGYETRDHADCYVQLGKMSYETASVVCGAPSNQFASIWLDVMPTHWLPLPAAPEKDTQNDQ